MAGNNTAMLKSLLSSQVEEEKTFFAHPIHLPASHLVGKNSMVSSMRNMRLCYRLFTIHYDEAFLLVRSGVSYRL